MFYIGIITHLVKIHIVEHHSKIISKSKETPLVTHFIEKGHSIDDFKFCVIYKCNIYDICRRCIQYIIVRIDLFPIIRMETDLKGHFKCHRCSVCTQTIEGSSYTRRNDPFTILMKQHTNYGSKGVIYLIVYKCNKLYIGMNTRIIQH